MSNPKSGPVNFLWSNNNARMIIELILYLLKIVYIPKQISGYDSAIYRPKPTN